MLYFPNRPLNVAHRGASRVAPENTLAAFRRALELGADGIECDVQLSADGQVVLMHDAAVDRTTNGYGRVSDLTLQQLRTLDAGTRFHPEYVGERIPMLEEVLAWLPAPAQINIEIKGIAFDLKGLEKKVVELVRGYGLIDRTIVSSFNPLALIRVRRLEPALDTGLLYEGKLPLYLRRAWLRPLVRPTALHPRWKLVSDAYLRWARGKGYDLNVWTVDEAGTMERLIEQGVQSIITNVPDVLDSILG